MPRTASKRCEAIACPNCERCGAEARLFGIETHPTVERTELRTYVCRQCDAIQTESVPLLRLLPYQGGPMPIVPFLANAGFDAETTLLLGSAFDAAWQTAKTAGGGRTDDMRAAAIRDVLARRIIEMGRRGERNRDRLVEDALAHLGNSRSAALVAMRT
jgi:hypothetical protein